LRQPGDAQFSRSLASEWATIPPGCVQGAFQSNQSGDEVRDETSYNDDQLIGCWGLNGPTRDIGRTIYASSIATSPRFGAPWSVDPHTKRFDHGRPENNVASRRRGNFSGVVSRLASKPESNLLATIFRACLHRSTPTSDRCGGGPSRYQRHKVRTMRDAGEGHSVFGGSSAIPPANLANPRLSSRLLAGPCESSGFVCSPACSVDLATLVRWSPRSPARRDTNDTNSTATRHRHDTDRTYRRCVTA
jgi:hypothetical protein